MHDHDKTFKHLKKSYKGLFKKIKVIIKHKLGWLGVPLIIAYRGFGNDNILFVKGHVTEDKGLAKPEIWNSPWQNALSMIKRYSSDGIPKAKVSLEIDGQKKKLITDEYGLYEAHLIHETEIPQSPSNWIRYSVTLQHELSENKAVTARGEILIPGPDARFGIISDIDDTILVSHSTKTLRKLWLMLLRNSRTRKPFPGVDAFYQALYKGEAGNQFNPFFYVSSSEWNLYDLLEDFCSYNKLPKGVFLLRELKTSVFKFWKSGRGYHNHKLEKIKLLFQTYPDLPFVLIGDSGQRDPEIYSAVAMEYPERIKAIYIRDVTGSQRDEKIRKIISRLHHLGVPMLLVRDMVQVSYHAAKAKLISKDSIGTIIQDAQNDMSSKPIIISGEKTDG